MLLEIHLQNYQNLPNIKRLKESEYSEFSYYSLGFQLSFTDENKNLEQKQHNLIFALVLFVDYYEKQLSILFDKSDYVIQYNTNFQNDFSKNKLEFKNNDGLEDYVNLKSIQTKTNPYNYKNLNEMFENYINNDIKIELSKIKKYLENNEINYHPQELNNFLNNIKNKINESFNEEYIRNLHPQEVFNINSVLMHNDLIKKIPLKQIQSHQKLKI